HPGPGRFEGARHRVPLPLPGRARLHDLLEPIRAPLQLPQLREPLFRLPVPGDVVPRRDPGKLLPQPREPRLLLLPLGPERGQLMDRLFAARPLPLPVRDGPRQLLPTRLRRGHFRWRRFELLATLLQPLPVLDQTVPLVLQVREYPLVLLPQRTPARGADPVRPGLPELPELLLQLLRPVPVRLEPRVDLLPPLDPRGALRLELPLRGLELRPQRLQLLAVLLEEPRRLLERREPLRAPRQLPDQRDLGFGKGVAPLREPGELREVLALLGDGGERGQLPAQRE